ncbi:MAG: aminopeptidase P family protein [Geminicoccaceae bacterium]|nr:aminopeptidase P family protein [Geminicoccaceae bacterium]
MPGTNDGAPLLHFDREEYEERRRRLLEAMASAELDAVLLFNQASLYWLTGYDTFGFCFFQSLAVTADGGTALLTRSADQRQARRTSIIEDVRIWRDRADAEPTAELAALVRDFGLEGKSVGVEWDTHGLTAANGRKLQAALGEMVDLKDASRLVDRLRLVKSQAELAHVRKAGDLCDRALEAAVAQAGAGVDEGLILARMHDAVFEAGGDYPANPFIVGSGPDALLCRYRSGRRRLDAQDQLTLEWAGVWRQYHAAAMRTLVIGTPSPRHLALHDAARDALLACEDTLRPGRSMGEVFETHAHTLDTHGLGAHRLNACGYSLGAVYAPSWMDWPMFYEGNPVVLEPGMVLFLHMIIADSDSGTAMTLGRTSIVGETAPESLSRLPLDLIRR